MKRPVTLSIAAAAVIVAVAVTVSNRADRSQPSDKVAVGGDSVWYHASDVAQLGRTGRPQLVEFFHPG